MKIFFLFVFVILCVVLVASAQKKVVCYWGTWSVYRQGNGKFEVTNIDPTLCTHIIYSFLGANSNGDVTYLDAYLDLTDNYGRGNIEKFIQLRSKSPSTKFMFSIGGWNAGSSTFSQIASDSNRRNRFAQNVLNICKKHRFDGFDFDWEYPVQRGGSSADKTNFVELLKELKRVLSGAGKILAIAVAAAESSASISYDIPNVAANVDFINLMSYDLHGSWETQCGINSPLYAGPSDVSFYQKQLNVDAIVKYWLSRGCPKEKLIVGIPLYGRSFTLANSINFQVGAPTYGPGAAGSFVSESGFLAYNEICYNNKYNGWRQFWENAQKVPYAVRGNQWVGYDDLQSVGIKLNYIRDNNLGGAMFWSIETDDFQNICGSGHFPLIRLAYTSLLGNIPPPTNSPTVIPTNSPTTTTKTTTKGSGGNFVCTSDGFFRDHLDCSKYYQCAGGAKYTFFCGSGTVFNPAINVCDWPSNVAC